MAIYKASDILDFLGEAFLAGSPYVELCEVEADEDSPTTLHVSYEKDEDFAIEDMIDSIAEDYNDSLATMKFSLSDIAPIAFTLDEVLRIKQSLDNAIEYTKEESKKPSYSKETLANMDSACVAFRNIQAKLNKFISHFQ